MIPQPRTLEIFRFLGMDQDIYCLGRAIPPMRQYKLPGGTEVIQTWNMVEKLEPSPSKPVVSLRTPYGYRTY